jgi:hypothetical protein
MLRRDDADSGICAVGESQPSRTYSSALEYSVNIEVRTFAKARHFDFENVNL